MRSVFAARVVLVVLALLGVSSTNAVAQTTVPPPTGTLDFVTDNGNGNYLALPTGSVTISLFLRETLANPSITSTLESERSIIGEAVRITRTGTPGSPAIITAATSDPFFNTVEGDAVDAGGAGATLSAFEFSATPTTFGAPILTDSPTVRRVRVGQITVRAGSIPFQTSTFTLADPTARTDDTFTVGAPSRPLDPFIQARQFTVSVLPEPGVVGLLGFAAAGLLTRRKRRTA